MLMELSLQRRILLSSESQVKSSFSQRKKSKEREERLDFADWVSHYHHFYSQICHLYNHLDLQLVTIKFVEDIPSFPSSLAR